MTAAQATDTDFQLRASQQNLLLQQMTANNGFALPRSENNAQVRLGLMTAFWQDGQLLLARRAVIDDAEYVQGCWLDWSLIREQLTGELAEGMPQARLEPAANASEGQENRRMAVLPVVLNAGTPPLAPPSLSPALRSSLQIAWGSVLLAAGIAALLLHLSLLLSARRADFVSAVTHEMRTPLTTFRLYTELLLDNRVDSPQRTRDYLATLHREADRLQHLVDNVLSYARLERRTPAAQQPAIPPAELIERALPRLIERAAQDDYRVCWTGPDGIADHGLRADPSAIEQILLNLIDNACKYAHPASRAEIVLSAACEHRQIVLRLRDFGPGIAVEDRRRIFKPFHKSARRAAESAPGVGLGLHLSRRLARDLGGTLELDEQVTDGAGFVLRLPCA